jgi:hypothetical protein
MKKFKIADFWISLFLMTTCTVFVLLSWEELGSSLVISYCIVGGWQVISMVTHVLTGYFTKRIGTRFLYHGIVLVVVILFPFTMWVLIYAAPFMAIFYTYMCYYETFVLLKRPMALLK